MPSRSFGTGQQYRTGRWWRIRALTPRPPLPTRREKGRRPGVRWRAVKRYVHNIPAARVLRAAETRSETLLWNELRDRRLLGLKFRRQHAIHNYVVDFYCDEYRLAVEVDGGIHADGEQRVRDRERQHVLESQGIRFARVAAEDVETNIEKVLKEIAANIKLTPDQGTMAGSNQET